MSKPTPGPMRKWIERYFDAEDEPTIDVTIDGIVGMVQALEIEGRAAVETLERIRAIMYDTRFTGDGRTDAVYAVIREVKPTGGKEST